MPMSPNEAYELTKAIRALYLEAEELVLQKLARQLARGIDSESWADLKYAEIQALNRQLTVLLDQLAEDVPGAVEQAIQLSYNRGVATAVNDLTIAGLGAGALAAAVVGLSVAGVSGSFVSPAVAVLTQAALGTLQAMPFRVIRWADDVYAQVTQETTAQMLTGALTRREASAAALKKYAVRGVTGFTDKSGRNWDLVAYAEMAARTTAAQAALQGHSDRITQLGVDLVIVSDAPAECALCRPWEGQVLSISGRSYGTLSDGTEVLASLATAVFSGLYHPNCRHGHTIYIPGVTKRFTNTEDPEGEALRQRQRAYERRIRDWKRRLIVDEELLGKNDPKTKATRAKLRQAQAEFRDWRTANDRKDLAYRTSLVSR